MGFLFSILGTLPGIIGQYFTTKAQIQLATIQSNTQAENNSFAMAQTMVAATSQKFKQWLITLLFTPFVIAILMPGSAQYIFNNLHAMPQWYLEECIIVFNTMLGISVGTGFISSLLSHVNVFTAQKALTKAQIEQINKQNQ